jgi:hypothetical protein
MLFCIYKAQWPPDKRIYVVEAYQLDTHTVAKIYNYLPMRKGMMIEGIFSCIKAGSPKGLTPATAAAYLSPYRTEVYHLTKRVIHACIDASKVEESIA